MGGGVGAARLWLIILSYVCILLHCHFFFFVFPSLLGPTRSFLFLPPISPICHFLPSPSVSLPRLSTSTLHLRALSFWMRLGIWGLVFFFFSFLFASQSSFLSDRFKLREVLMCPPFLLCIILYWKWSICIRIPSRVPFPPFFSFLGFSRTKLAATQKLWQQYSITPVRANPSLLG